MQPNKSVEEIEQLIKYFRGRTGGWGMVLDKSISEIEKDLRKNLQELLTSHTNTVLQGVVERVEKEKVKVYDNWATSHDRDEERFTKLTKEEKGYNKGLDLSLSLINDQIISNEEKKETWETKVGMLRQWLNEDRITDPQKMVTNEQIIKWLE